MNRHVRDNNSFLGHRRWDAPLQQAVDTRAEEDWMHTTEGRCGWETLEPEFVRRVLRRQVHTPPLPRRRHYVDEWHGDAQRDEDFI